MSYDIMKSNINFYEFYEIFYKNIKFISYDSILNF